MQIIELTEDEFDKLMNRLDKVEMEKTGISRQKKMSLIT